MKIVSVDPGISTGIVHYNSKRGEIVCITTLSIDEVIEFLVKIKPNILIVERMPKYPTWKLELINLYHDILSLDTDKLKIHTITPGMWKPVAKALEWTAPDTCKTQHEKDAYNILRYWLIVHYSDLIGEEK